MKALLLYTVKDLPVCRCHCEHRQCTIYRARLPVAAIANIAERMELLAFCAINKMSAISALIINKSAFGFKVFRYSAN